MSSSSKILSLHGKGLKLDTRADIEPWIKDLDPTTIEEIHLGGNTIGVDASQTLAEFLERTTVLKVADFADIFTGRLISEIPPALSAICDSLKDKTSLVEINLSDNAFGGRSVDPMVPFLTTNRSFQVLKLTNNGLGPAGGSVIADALLTSANRSKAEGKASNLRTVICGRNRLEDGSAGAWAVAFEAHGTLVDVRMPQNGIRMEGITKLARGLKECKELQHIDFQDNAFSADGKDVGVKAWAEALPSWPDLMTLNLSDCVLSTGRNVPLLVKALAYGSNPKLRTLQLQNNDLETQTFALFAEVISTHLSNVMMLELQWNDVEDDDGSLESVEATLKQRGGKLLILDDDEEESDEEEEEEEEAVDDHEKEVPSTDSDPANSLADLLSKTSLN